MKKLKLDLEMLRIDSFDAGSAESGGGTVHARQRTTTTLLTNQISCDYSARYESCHAACECTNAAVRCKNPDAI